MAGAPARLLRGGLIAVAGLVIALGQLVARLFDLRSGARDGWTMRSIAAAWSLDRPAVVLEMFSIWST